MPISLIHLVGHLLCSILLVILGLTWKINRRWVAFFTFLFLISPCAVFLIWVLFHGYGLYVVVWAAVIVLAKGTDKFYSFLKTQEVLIQYFFWAAVIVFGAADLLMSVTEINLRHDALGFWTYETKQHPTAASWNELAATYQSLGNFSKAQESYSKAASHDPHSLKAYEGLSHLSMQQNQWKQAIKYYRKMIDINPALPESYLGLGEAFRSLGDSAQTVETYSRLLNLYPDDEKIDIKVIEAYGHAIDKEPQNEIYKEKREEVLADFEQLSKRKNYNAVDYYNLGFLYEQVGGKDEAMRFYAKAVQMKADYKEALYSLANLYRDTGNYKLALATYSRLLHFHPKVATGYLNMGKIFNALGDSARARQLYQKTIDVEPNNADAYFYLGYLGESQGELNDAVNDYEKAVELDPKNAEAFYNLGNVYASLGQNGEAIASYLKTVSINPKHQDAYVNLSILSFKARDFQGAIHYLEQAQSLGYNPPVAYLKTLEPYRK